MADKNLKNKQDDLEEEASTEVDLSGDISDLYTESTEDLAAEELEDDFSDDEEDGLEDFADVDLDADTSEEFEEVEE